MVFDFSNKKAKKKNTGKDNKWKWKTQLCEIFKKIGGIEKVEADRPSTGPFGNWGIIGAVQRMSDLSPTHNFSTKLLMGKKTIGANKKTKMDFSLSKRDGESDVQKQVRNYVRAHYGHTHNAQRTTNNAQSSKQKHKKRQIKI